MRNAQVPQQGKVFDRTRAHKYDDVQEHAARRRDHRRRQRNVRQPVGDVRETDTEVGVGESALTSGAVVAGRAGREQRQSGGGESWTPAPQRCARLPSDSSPKLGPWLRTPEQAVECALGKQRLFADRRDGGGPDLCLARGGADSGGADQSGYRSQPRFACPGGRCGLPVLTLLCCLHFLPNLERI